MSQGSANVPTGGSESATTFAGQVNTALNAVLSKNSGNSAPANGPGSAPVIFQSWVDTTAALFPVLKMYDGAAWPRVGSFDTANGIFCPQLGGGTPTIVAATTTDLGSKVGSFITITGTLPISSFGSSAVPGEERTCYAGGQFTITASSLIVTPGAQDIVTSTGDTWRAIYTGVGVWLIRGYERGANGVGVGLPSGAHFWRLGTSIIPGTVRANGNTIGATGSGGTEATGSACFNLYSDLWNGSVNASATAAISIASPGVVTWNGHGQVAGVGVVFTTTGTLPTGLVAGTVYYLINPATNTFQVSATPGGAAINTSVSQSGVHTAWAVDPEIVISGAGRGAAALADWNAGKTITTPDLRGRTPYGLDKMGAAVAANKVTSLTAFPDGKTIGAVAGAEVVTQTVATMAAHAHTGSGISPNPHHHNIVANQTNSGNVAAGSPTDAGYWPPVTNTTTADVTLTLTIATQGGGGAHLNMQPGKAGTWYIAL